mmetsp:Transcript_119733/g.346071  ORF Transcript_119733/g.346071 Transcript_119733/m.346071 type:complete len:314 (-) Transcript_119733:175-1116(-)
MAHQEEDREALVRPPAARRSAAGASVLAVLASALGLVALVGGASFAWTRAARPAASSSRPLTVRALLQSDEVADATTDNLMALHSVELGAVDRSEVRERVASGLRGIDTALEQLHPQAHRRLGELRLKSVDRAAAMRSLQVFADARLVDAGRAAVDEFRSASADGADDATVERRLADRLAPKFVDLARAGAELLPQRHAIPLNLGPVAAQWHPTVEVDVDGRRLEAHDSVVAGVNAHAAALFRSLENTLGEDMPKAPARMLYTSSSGNTENTSLMGCLKDAMPHPTKVISCLVQNMGEVMAMAKQKFQSLTSR